MANRLELQTKLEELLGSRNVYYQPPASFLMKYPAIRYSNSNIRSTFANNKTYSRSRCYELIVIAKELDHEVIDKLLELPHCSHNRHYVADNLNHDVFTLYW